MITIDMKLFSWLAPVEMLKIKKRTTEAVRQKTRSSNVAKHLTKHNQHIIMP